MQQRYEKEGRIERGREWEVKNEGSSKDKWQEETTEWKRTARKQKERKGHTKMDRDNCN